MNTCEFNDEELHKVMVQWLGGRGYDVVLREEKEPGQWMTFYQFCKLVGKKANVVSRKLRYANCPVFEQTGTERICTLKVTERLVKFVRQYGGSPV